MGLLGGHKNFFKCVRVDYGLNILKEHNRYAMIISYKTYCRLCEIAGKDPLPYKDCY